MVKAFVSISFFAAMGAGWIADALGHERVTRLAVQARDVFDPSRMFGPSCPAQSGRGGPAFAV